MFQVLRSLTPEVFPTSSVVVRQLSSHGGYKTKLVSLRDAIQLVMVLPGKAAKETRQQFAGVIQRYLAGDKSLSAEIAANAASDAPIQQAFRASLAQESAGAALDEHHLGQKRERDEMSMASLAGRRLRLEEAEFRLREREKALEHMSRGMELMHSIKTGSDFDERTKVQFEDHIKNVILSSSSPFSAITNGGAGVPVPPAVNETAALNISIVATELGYKCTDKELIQMGREMATRYREKYQRDPPKHKQYVKGNYIPVNSYMERDRPLMEGVIRAVVNKRGSNGNETESQSD